MKGNSLTIDYSRYDLFILIAPGFPWETKALLIEKSLLETPVLQVQERKTKKGLLEADFEILEDLCFKSYRGNLLRCGL